MLFVSVNSTQYIYRSFCFAVHISAQHRLSIFFYDFCCQQLLPPRSSNESESECLLPSDIIDWTVIFTGVAIGLIIGIVVGNIIYTRYSDCFIDRFGLRKDGWVRPLSNTGRNKVFYNISNICIIYFYAIS